MALGASGAWIGTRFLASEEVAVHPHYRERLLQATEDDTVYLDELFDIGWPKAPNRVLRNSTVTVWEAAGRPRLVNAPAKARSWLHRNLVAQLCAIAHIHQAQTRTAI